MPATVPTALLDLCATADPSWHAILKTGLQAIARLDSDYLPALVQDTTYLPTEGRIFAAFKQPIDQVRYVLVGEGPYPRAASATGVCFMDGAVGSLWSDKGLSKQVNRATSLRNFMKIDPRISAELARLEPNQVGLLAWSLLAHPPAQAFARLQQGVARWPRGDAKTLVEHAQLARPGRVRRDRAACPGVVLRWARWSVRRA